MQLRDATDADFDAVLELNEASVPHVNSIDLGQLQWFARHAHYFRVARLDNALAGFLIGLGPGLDYASPNYRWFCGRHRRFAYVDRVAVAPIARRRGVASRLYDDFAGTMTDRAGVLACEVNIRPPNASSMDFHLQRGFVSVATQETEGGAKEVALMEMSL